MKLDKHLLEFPRHIPNDLEGFILFYPRKYPDIISYFEDLVKKIGADPEAFEKYREAVKAELLEGVAKIKADFGNGNQEDLEFLVDTDMRINKLFCHRFWPINYLFADGPLHDFYVDTLRAMISKFVDVTDDIEEYETRVASIERDLLQSDFADDYLRQAFEHIELVKLLKMHSKIAKLVGEAEILIRADPDMNADKINMVWGEVVEQLDKDEASEESVKIMEILADSFRDSSARKEMFPVYNTLTMAVEFYNDNQQLEMRHEMLQAKIEKILNHAKTKLDREDYELLELAYLQARNFIKAKDAMVDVDKSLLNMWFGVHDKCRELVEKKYGTVPPSGGHCEMFYSLSWYFPAELKAKIFTIDNEPYSLETL